MFHRSRGDDTSGSPFCAETTRSRHPLAASAYRCERCRYVLDPTCARLPQVLRHPAHPLTLHLLPAYSTGDLPCAGLPEKLSHPSHPHPVTLVHQDPTGGRGYVCDLCGGAFDASSQWLYIWRAFDFGGHISCFMSGTKPAEQVTAAQQQIDPAAALSGMQQKLMAQMFMADTLAQTGRNVVALTGGPRDYVYYNAAPLPSQYAAMANSIVMNNLALLSLTDQKTGGGGGPAGGDVARSAGNTSTMS
ncbi:hypothetical protein OPV22_030487 [Ensete ventricosum]|uniref:C2H2-type domain-containing protein n=1 Tax=Ensete ventricosum TaxID=4639 RepID=A0AAV8Q966_ENSVE|nr:hypothetical protein OPV22_030487 [Ensete ventricosum]